MTQPYFWPQTSSQLGWRGNTPGLPHQFQYVEVPFHPTYVNPEYAVVWPPDGNGIRQNKYHEPIIGNFQSAVYDVPFDFRHHLRTQNLMSQNWIGSMNEKSLWFPD